MIDFTRKYTADEFVALLIDCQNPACFHSLDAGFRYIKTSKIIVYDCSCRKFTIMWTSVNDYIVFTDRSFVISYLGIYCCRKVGINPIDCNVKMDNFSFKDFYNSDKIKKLQLLI